MSTGAPHPTPFQAPSTMPTAMERLALSPPIMAFAFTPASSMAQRLTGECGTPRWWRAAGGWTRRSRPIRRPFPHEPHLHTRAARADARAARWAWGQQALTKSACWACPAGQVSDTYLHRPEMLHATDPVRSSVNNLRHKGPDRWGTIQRAGTDTLLHY